MKRIILVIPALLFLVILVTGLSWHMGKFSLNFPDEERYPLRGIDVSYDNGTIDWFAVPRGQYDFAYIKATQGGDWTDPLFASNWTNARDAGLQTGAYHAFSLCRDGADQARHFIATAPHENNTLAPAIDLEYAGNCKDRPARAVLLAELDKFTAAVTDHYGTAPVIYTTYDFYRDYLAGSQYTHSTLWIRSLFGAPHHRKTHDWHIWQYADNARIPGIHGPVDVNVMKTE